MNQKLNKTQILGLALVGLSLFTYMGGPALVGGIFNLSFTGMKLLITVKDSANIPIQDAVITITGIDWQDTGVHVSLNVELDPTEKDGTSGTSISTWGRVYVSVSADGYVTATGSLSAGSTETASKTFKLTKTPDPVPDPTPDPEPTPEPEPDPDPTPEPEPEPDPVPDPDPTPDPEPDPTPEPDVDVSEDIGNMLQTYSIFTGALGAGIFTLGGVKKEEKR
jgi:hypothetical protein